MPPGRIPLPPVVRERGFVRPRVVLEVDRSLSISYRDRTANELADEGVGTRADWDSLVSDFSGVETRRVFRADPARIDELEQRAAARTSSYPVGSLRRYYTVEVPPGSRAIDELMRRVRSLHGVSHAWIEEIGPPPLVLSAANPRWNASPTVPGQRYLGKAPSGIDAEYAWTQPGGDGAGMVLIDVEEGWTLDHEDLVANGSMLLRGFNVPDTCGHGTSVLGIVCGTDDNGLGGVGIVPNLNSADVASYANTYGSPGQGQPPKILNASIADAITLAATRLSAGQVLLLEAQVYGPNGMLCPAEIGFATRAAIRCATAAGIVVVEAGGNGDEAGNGVDLDQYKDSAGRTSLAAGTAEFEDTGAILVSAADSTTRVRLPWAPFGKRIDCWAWGDGIDTCDSAVTQAGRVKDIYRQDFGGTSGAAAIVAGAVLALQGVAKAWTGSMLTPDQVRSILRSVAVGTAASPPVAEGGAPPPANRPIGRMPDLRAILDTVMKVPRILVRDTVQDDGTPHQGVVDASPDILVEPAAGSRAGGNPAPAAAAAPPQVVRGVEHSVRVVVRNPGGSAASGVVVDVYETDPAQVVQAVNWTFVGRANVPTVPVGGAPVTSAAIAWPAAKLPAAGARLVVAVLGTATTPPVVPPDLVKESNFVHLVRATSLLAARAVVVVHPTVANP